MQRIIKIMVILAVMAMGATAAQALPSYVMLFTTAYPQATMMANCGLCHVNPAGGGTRNSFGLAFAAAGDSFTAAVANAPSRCSGYTNLQMINLGITPGDGTTCPTATSACASYTYTLGACQSNNTAPVLSSVGVPAGCSGGATPATTQPCTYVPPVTACTSYTYTLGACQSNNTAPVLTSVGVPAGCSGGATPATTQSCTYVAPTCSYTYSVWGACQSSGTQTRTVTSTTPAGCTGTPVTTQSCTYVPPVPGTGACDFNGDGNTDLVWRNKSTGENTIWLMSGATHMPGNNATLPSVLDTNWKVVGIADMNGSGQPDIIWRNMATGENKVWVMSGATHIPGNNAALPSEPDTNWEIVGIADMNGSGQPDIIWRNMATGENRIWFMNGVTYVSGATLPSVLDTNWEIVGPK
jgi:hypothetical protein